MSKYSDYNIIPIGDHCAISIILKELNLRTKSYPFDWVTNQDQLYNTNIIYNIELINELNELNELNLEKLVKKYIGNAFDNNKKINTNNNIWFPHDFLDHSKNITDHSENITDHSKNITDHSENITDHSENITNIFEKYKRRFTRLKQDLNKKNIFILLTRHYYIEKDKFQQIMEQLLNYNNDSIIIFCSGTDHTYFDNSANYNNVIFKYIKYDISQFYNYDYTSFRPNIKIFLSDLLLSSTK